MIYSLILKLNYQEDLFSYDLDTNYLDITFSDMSKQSPVSMETKKLTIGTTDGKFHLIDLWDQLSQIDINTIDKIVLRQNNIDYPFSGEIENIFYLVNFNGPGDIISFCYNKETPNPVEDQENSTIPEDVIDELDSTILDEEVL